MDISLERERSEGARAVPHITRPEPELERGAPERDRGGRFRRLSKTVPAFVVAGVLAMTLTGCAESDYAEICLDPSTAVQVEDARCDARESNAAGSAFLWYYLARGNVVPGVGKPIPGGVSALSNPKVGSISKPATGSISKGGFGGGFKGGAGG